MLNRKISPAYVVVLLLLQGASLTGYAKTHHRKPRKAPAKVVQPAAPVPQPEPPPTPEHGPASPPEVGFEGGQLTIVARNSTMADVLAAVKQKTGASVEMPAASGERVVGRFGPGAPRDVMAQLLNGSHYDYVLMGSPADPRALEKVVLIARANGPEAVSAQQNSASVVNQNLQALPSVSPDADQENGEMPPDAQLEAQPEVQQEEPQPEQPGQQNPTVKTPEQLLRELQQQQQQQQQQGAPPQ